MFLTIGRTMKAGGVNFMRNGYLSVAAVSVMLLSLFSISALAVFILSANTYLETIESRVNVSVYFKPDISEESIMKNKSELENFNEIKTVEYISKEKALEDFKKNNANEPSILEALEVLGGNPLNSALVIRANSPSSYDIIDEYLKKSSFKDDISRTNYNKSKPNIDRLNIMISQARKVGTGVAGLLTIISILIIFNTIRITIYSHKKEVEVMRLVGASNIYIRLPFIFEGIIYGLIASIISMFLLFGALKWVMPNAKLLIPSTNIMDAYTSHFFVLFGAQVLLGSFLGIVSSLIAIRKYLKI
ncbi:MAG: permease-like cell division protein FtsX [Candidatus Moraniibacteriota bacterium]